MYRSKIYVHIVVLVHESLPNLLVGYCYCFVCSAAFVGRGTAFHCTVNALVALNPLGIFVIRKMFWVSSACYTRYSSTFGLGL